MNNIESAIGHLKVGNYTGHQLDMAIEALEKQMPKAVIKDEYNEEHDSYGLTCSNCNNYVGELENEDGEGIYKYNLFYNYCSKCGQRLKVDYS